MLLFKILALKIWAFKKRWPGPRLPVSKEAARTVATPLILLALLLVSACSQPGVGVGPMGQTGPAEPTAPTTPATLTVFAAASLTDAFAAIGAQFEQQNDGVTVAFQFAGSSQLRAQLAEGAVADGFASSNESQMQQAEAANLITMPSVIFVRNRLVIIHPADNPAGLTNLQDLARDNVLMVTAAPEVPIGAYTLQMLELASGDPNYGSDFAVRVRANIVSEETNVRQMVAKVQLGEADAAIVYRSDVTPDVREDLGLITVPKPFNIRATYPIGVLAEAPHPELAQAFIDFVLGPVGQGVLADWGFESVEQ